MFQAVLGWFLVISGVIFFLNPQFFKKRLEKKTIKQARRVLFVALFFISVFFISLVYRLSGITFRIILVLGIIVLLKSFFLLKARAAGKIVEWSLGLPPVLFRGIAAFQVLLGLSILVFKN